MVATPEPVWLTSTKAPPGLRHGGPPTSLAEHSAETVLAKTGMFGALLDGHALGTFKENGGAIRKNAGLSGLSRKMRFRRDTS